jgi:hypothetical protein
LLLEEYENPQKIPLKWFFGTFLITHLLRSGTRRNSCANGGTIADQFTCFQTDASEGKQFPLGISAGFASVFGTYY